VPAKAGTQPLALDSQHKRVYARLRRAMRGNERSLLHGPLTCRVSPDITAQTQTLAVGVRLPAALPSPYKTPTKQDANQDGSHLREDEMKTAKIALAMLALALSAPAHGQAVEKKQSTSSPAPTSTPSACRPRVRTSKP